MASSDRIFSEALELFRSSAGSLPAPERIGRAVNYAIPSDIAAIEVFTAEGAHAGRSWALPQPLIEEHFPGFLKHRVEHPFFPEFLRSGLREPACISDYVSMGQLRSMGLFTDFFSPLGIQRQMGVALRVEPAGTPILVLGRSGADYSQGDRRRLRQVLRGVSDVMELEITAERYALLTMVLEDAANAVLLLDRDFKLLYSTARAREILRRFYADPTVDALPPGLIGKLRSCDLHSLKNVSIRSNRTASILKISIWASAFGCQYALALEEEMSPEAQIARSLALSKREAQVLTLVMEGLTNGQIAHRLRRSPHTIRTQVEAILFKLAVPNRTAAAMVARAVLPSRRKG